MVEVSASEARAKGLPPASLSLDTGSSGMTAFPFPQEGGYLRLSGPPGGPMGMKVEPLSDAAELAADEAGLAALAEARFAEDSPERGTSGRVELAGATRPAFTCATGGGFARAVHLLVLVPAPEGGGGILVDAWSAARQPGVATPSAFLETAPWNELLGSLSVRFE